MKKIRTSTYIDSRGNVMKIRITDKQRLNWLIRSNPTVYIRDEEYPAWGDRKMTRLSIDAAIREDGRKK